MNTPISKSGSSSESAKLKASLGVSRVRPQVRSGKVGRGNGRGGKGHDPISSHDSDYSPVINKVDRIKDKKAKDQEMVGKEKDQEKEEEEIDQEKEEKDINNQRDKTISNVNMNTEEGILEFDMSKGKEN
ncbi:Hypothetical predicted protein [Mytilus galloprovincialis]|uniref:Uncharacterized protein n=1 Tax=Mytilus galloprovincialis TaxID=29158 RepID=A0A8B6C6S1_MYTGA|nr:Hypothetical predicted protein [Mytilus galloprovincialis]